MKKYAVGVIALVLSAGSASAGEWRIVTVNDHGLVAVDVSSLRRSGRQVTGWSAGIFPTTNPQGADYGMLRIEWDCVNETSATLAMVFFNTQGNQVDRIDGRQPATAIAPETTAMGVLDMACATEQADDDHFWFTVSDLVADYRRP